MNNALRTAIDELRPVINAATNRAVDRVYSGKPAVPTNTGELAARVTQEVAAVVVNQTNAEPWYQSRVTWGAIIAVLAGLAGIMGYTFDAADQATLVNAIVGAASIVGGLIAWYGRWVAKKPIGQ